MPHRRLHHRVHRTEATMAEAARRPGIGYSLPRREDDRFIRGQGTFVADVSAPHMAHMAVLRSPLARARIRSINATRAFTLPGVLVVITGELPARRNQIGRASCRE